MNVSDLIRKRIKDAGADFHANDNIAQFIEDGELDDIEIELEVIIHNLLDALVIDTMSDHNTTRTSERMARMFLREIFAGRYERKPETVNFPNVKKLDQVYTIGPITINSTCSHHFVPVSGRAWLGIIPDKMVIGLSKFKRLTDWIMCRPQIQEEATVQLADLIEEKINPRGLGLVIKARHQCMICRGVKETDTTMVTSIMRGIFFDNPIARQEFLSLIKDNF